MNEIVFEVTQETDGGFVAQCLTEAIFAQADNWQELRKQVRDAVDGYFFRSGQARLNSSASGS